jgi:hypothetical protein
MYTNLAYEADALRVRRVLSAQTVRYWGAFTRYGAPRVHGQPFWPDYSSRQFESLRPGSQTTPISDAEYAAEQVRILELRPLEQMQEAQARLRAGLAAVRGRIGHWSSGQCGHGEQCHHAEHRRGRGEDEGELRHAVAGQRSSAGARRPSACVSLDKLSAENWTLV